MREKFPDYNRLPIALIVDLRIVPKILRGTATRVMESAYKQSAAEVPAGYDPADHLILLPDWSGEVFTAYQIGDVNHQMKLVLVGPTGTIQQAYQGPDAINVAHELVRPFMREN